MTAADFFADAEHYDPTASFDSAAAEVLGSVFAAPARRFAELAWRSCLTRSGHHFRYDKEDGCNAPFETAFAAGKEALFAYANESAALLALLESADADFVGECRRWLDTAKTFCAALAESCKSGDPQPLRVYLKCNEDIMKPEAYRVIGLLEP